MMVLRILNHKEPNDNSQLFGLITNKKTLERLLGDTGGSTTSEHKQNRSVGPSFRKLVLSLGTKK